MSSEEVKELLEELLLNYRARYTETFREVKNVAEQESITSMAETAWKTFQSLFRNRPELTQKLLADESEGAEPSILRVLLSMAEEVQRERPGGLGTSTWSASTDTTDELTDVLEPFIRDHVDGDEPLIWPFVRIIRLAYPPITTIIGLTLHRIYLRSYILRNGLVLADLPGKP